MSSAARMIAVRPSWRICHNDLRTICFRWGGSYTVYCDQQMTPVDVDLTWSNGLIDPQRYPRRWTVLHNGVAIPHPPTNLRTAMKIAEARLRSLGVESIL